MLALLTNYSELVAIKSGYLTLVKLYSMERKIFQLM
jgi:hypothetical protein